MKREPHHFTYADFGKALFGSFVVGLTFLFKGGLMDYASTMDKFNVVLILVITGVLLTIEIYALSYKFVVHKRERPFYEFWAKRFFAITISSFAAIFLALYLYGFNNYFSIIELLKITSAVFMPATITGAAIEMLKK